MNRTDIGRRTISLRIWKFGTISLGLLLAGCQVFSRQGPPPIDAQSASLVCARFDVGVDPQTFNRCVAYQESRPAGPSVPPYRQNQYGNMVDAEGYQVDSMGHRMPVQNHYYLPTGQASPR